MEEEEDKDTEHTSTENVVLLAHLYTWTQKEDIAESWSMHAYTRAKISAAGTEP